LQDPPLLIRLFSALNRASHADLGFDPTISRIHAGPPACKPTLRITVHDAIVGRKQYDAVQVLSVASADPMMGRGTRVWLVKETDNPDAPLRVLKDSWVDSGRTREGANMAKICNLLVEKDPEARKHFLTVEACGDVCFNFGDNDHPVIFDCTEHNRRNAQFDLNHSLPLATVADAPNSSIVGATPMMSQSRMAGLSAHKAMSRALNRHHYRIVFEEPGQAIHGLASRQDMFRAVCDAARGERCAAVFCICVDLTIRQSL
jgi:hypothetical protein